MKILWSFLCMVNKRTYCASQSWAHLMVNSSNTIKWILKKSNFFIIWHQITFLWKIQFCRGGVVPPPFFGDYSIAVIFLNLLYNPEHIQQIQTNTLHVQGFLFIYYKETNFGIESTFVNKGNFLFCRVSDK